MKIWWMSKKHIQINATMKWIVLKGNAGERYTAVLIWWNMWIYYWWKKNVIAERKKPWTKQCITTEMGQLWHGNVEHER